MGAYHSFSIPMEFINSPVGSVLFTVKFGAPKRTFGSKDITRILGVTRSLLSHDLGKTLIAFKSYRPILVNETDLINYMSSKGLLPEESRERIDSYLMLISEKASDDEISKTIDAVKHKYSSKL